MAIPPAVLEVHRRLKEVGYQSYLVGGCVRDTLLGRQPKDFDLATSARPEQVQAVFKKVIPTGIAHGTVTVLTHGEHVEVTTFRSEGKYLDGRRPETVEFHSDIEADLSRRDFTINAMALDPVTDALVDPFGGQTDLAAKLVRCVRDPLERFSEDGLRALRAVRFATVLDFSLDPVFEAAIPTTIPTFRKIARERVRDELLKIIGSPHVDRGLELLERTGLLKEILPGAAASSVRHLTDPDLRLAVLLRSAPRELELLKLPGAQMLRISAVAKNLALPPLDDDVALRRFMSKHGRDIALDVLQVSGTEALQSRARAQTGPLTVKELALDGAAIMKTLAVGPGRAVGEASRFLLEQVLERPELNTPEQLRALLTTFKA